MRTLIASIIALLSLTMISCSDNAEMMDYVQSSPAAAKTNGSATRMDAEDAYVRIGMYANIEGYNVRIKNMRVEDCLSSRNLSGFGSEIAQAEVLPTTAETAIYDNAEGKYNGVAPIASESWVIVHFDVEITSAGQFESKMVINDVKYYISPAQASWKSGNYYDYVIGIDAAFLGLSSIDFNANVEDFQNGNNADVNC